MAAHYVNRIAPVNLHAPRSVNDDMASHEGGGGGGESSSNAGYFTFTVGKLDAGMAILIGDRASQIEFPSLLLPAECTTGSVVRISVSRNQKEEQRKKREFDDLQRDVLETYGRVGPQAPSLTLRAVTQTSITLEWEKLDLAKAKLLSLDIFRNNERLAAIPNPLNNTSTKLSGLEVNKPYSFHLVMRTTAGTFTSNVIKTKTHDMNDTTGISVCFGFIDGSYIDEEGTYVDGELEAQAKEMLRTLGAKWSDKVQIDTTHFVCTHPRSRATNAFGEGNPAGQMRGAMFSKAAQLSIPIVLPHWIYACIDQKKLVPISTFYIDKEPPNASRVRELIGRRSSHVDGHESPKSGAQQSIDHQTDTLKALESSAPPTPISKSVSHEAIPAAAFEERTSGEGREAEADVHPIAAASEEPSTTTTTDMSHAAEEQEVHEMESSLVTLDDDESTPVVPVGTVDDVGTMDEGDEETADRRAGQMSTSSSAAGGLNTSVADDVLETISLGGGSVKGDATEEIDLS